MNGATDRGARGDRLGVSAGTRVGVSFVVGIVVLVVAALVGPWQVAVLAAWAATVAVYVAWVWLSVWPLDAEATRRAAMREDSSRAVADLVIVLASVVNLVGVGFALVEAAGRTRLAAGTISAFVVLSVSLSWAAVHTLFALRYAHLYYGGGGGIEFGDEPPDYADFAYLAFTLGMTYQVSDTPLTAKTLRRTALRHTLLSYLFGVVIAATVINVVAGLFRG
ncbi:MAG: DUF1345 domain-containing protein [Actinomycetota bacterium]